MREIFRVQRLGKNLGRYFGETIDIRAVLRDAETAALHSDGEAELAAHATATYSLPAG